MKASTIYVKELRDFFRYIPTWLPTTPLSLGDIGIFQNNEFIPISNVSELNIDFSTIHSENGVDLHYSSEGIEIINNENLTKLESDHDINKISLSIKFPRENAILFSANGIFTSRIKNQITLGKKVLSLNQKNKWNLRWIIITELLQAECATILISNSKNAEIELSVIGAFGSGIVDIADSKLNFKVKNSKNLSTKIISQKSLTPLFRASRLKPIFFGKDDFVPFRAKSLKGTVRVNYNLGDIMTPYMVRLKENMHTLCDIEDFDF